MEDKAGKYRTVRRNTGRMAILYIHEVGWADLTQMKSGLQIKRVNYSYARCETRKNVRSHYFNFSGPRFWLLLSVFYSGHYIFVRQS